MKLPIAISRGAIALRQGNGNQDRSFSAPPSPLCAVLDDSAGREAWLDGVLVLSLAPSVPRYLKWLAMAGARVEPADSPESAIRTVESGRGHQILIVDAVIAGECNLAVAEHITSLRPWCRVVVVSPWLSGPILARAQRLSNASVVTHGMSHDDFLLAVLSSSRCTACLLHTLSGQIARRTRLSPQQERLLWLNLWGYSDQEIGTALGIQLHTVQDYQLTLRRKTGVRSKAGYLRLLLEYLGTQAPLDASERLADSGMFPTQSREQSG